MRRVPALDGIRGIAILLVLALHFEHVIGGMFGVDLFFVLSGFLITSLLADELGRNGRIDFGRFYRRRAVRLFPPLALMVALTLPLAIGWSHRPTHELGSALIGVSYTTNLALLFHPASVTSPFIHLWSLAVEEQFYLLWPPILFLLWRRRWLPVALIVAAGLSVTDYFLIASGAPNNYWRDCGPDTHAAPILLGCAAALLYRRGFRVGAPMAWVGVAGAAAFAALHSTRPGLGYFAAFAAFAVLPIMHVASADTALSRGLSLRPLRYTGRISYSLYLWNTPVLTLLALPRLASLALVFALAAGSWRYLENPLLKRRRKVREPRAEPVAAATAATL